MVHLRMYGAFDWFFYPFKKKQFMTWSAFTFNPSIRLSFHWRSHCPGSGFEKKLCPFGGLSLACLCYQEEL